MNKVLDIQFAHQKKNALLSHSRVCETSFINSKPLLFGWLKLNTNGAMCWSFNVIVVGGVLQDYIGAWINSRIPLGLAQV